MGLGRDGQNDGKERMTGGQGEGDGEEKRGMCKNEDGSNIATKSGANHGRILRLSSSQHLATTHAPPGPPTSHAGRGRGQTVAIA